ncbi:hypothetical protein GGS23DRAFT_466593 [Durotheca rogersii]|uniref:uncharacterized protein n=1 Tax=Durotheca rogersii TaxID=419775 RepID=UPI00221F7951|nr:uncharacterized protein GGS23DRAFT_466593 [Durotheca rogersii]KAI5864856.1 hypothetical protein GGS23DRAFT_466593 [Durotheca rogersii]
MGNLLGKEKIKTPMTIPSDTVIPLHFYDDTPVNRSVIVEFTMRFDDVLDADKLRTSLEKLLSRRDWRKLGARLRLNSNGKLEYHVPEAFSENRPAFAYSHSTHDVGIASHPLASRLPRPTAKPTVLDDPSEFGPLLRRWGAPQTILDYLTTDAPQLSLHIVSFTDATIVTLSWPHTLLDAIGRKELLAAWTATLEGREDDVKPLHGVYRDPLESLGANPKEPYVLAHRHLSPVQSLLFVLSYIWATIFWWGGEETRMVCVPARHANILFESARDDLSAPAAQCANDDKKLRPFISEGDILSGWITRLALVHLRHVDQTVSIMNAFGLRSALAKDLLPPTSAYVGNAVGSVYAFLSMRDLFAQPLGYTAAVVRRSISEQGTRDQVEAHAAIERAALRQGRAPVFGNTKMTPVMISNWSKAKFFETDFSAALVARPGSASDGDNNNNGGGDDDATTPRPPEYRPGRPTYIQPNGLVNRQLPTRNSFPIVGKDAAGNYWFSGTLQHGLWGQVQEALDAEYRYFSQHDENVRRLQAEKAKGF